VGSQLTQQEIILRGEGGREGERRLRTRGRIKKLNLKKENESTTDACQNTKN
jgi:hypothetical protein